MFDNFHKSVVDNVFQPVINYLEIKPIILARNFVYLYTLLCMMKQYLLFQSETIDSSIVIPAVLFFIAPIALFAATWTEVIFKEVMNISNTILTLIILLCLFDFILFVDIIKLTFLVGSLLSFCFICIVYLARCYSPPPKKNKHSLNFATT